MGFSLKYKGFDYVAFYNGAYEDSDSLTSLLSTGANSIEATLDYGINVATSQVVVDPNYTDSLAALGTTIAQAESFGLSVMVRPLIDFLNPAESSPYSVGDWRQDYVPTNTAAFFASYQKMIVAEATVAQQNGAQMLSIGAELDQLAGPHYLSYWTSIISAVHEVFSGKLTYSASWNTASQVSFWSQLDYEGIDCYVPLSNAANPTLQNLINGWTTPATQSTNPGAFAVIGNQSPIQYFENLAAQSGKPLLFTELGYANDSGAAANPSASGNSPDPTLQAELYQAFFKAWAQSGSSSLVGAYFWEWDPNGSSANVGSGVDSFSPQNSVAQSAATAGFSVPEITLTGAGGTIDINDPIISGTVDLADASGSVQLFENNQPIGGPVAVSAQGTFSTTINLPADGIYTIIAAEANADGVVGTSNPITFDLISSPPVAAADAFTVAENATLAGHNVFADNGSGVDTGTGFSVTAVDGFAADVGSQITLGSGAHLTLNADGSFSYDPNHAFDSPTEVGATATDSFNYTITGGSTAVATVRVTAVASGNRMDYQIANDNAGQTFIVTDQRQGSPDGSHTINHAAQLQFADGVSTYNYDTNGALVLETFDNANGTHWVNAFDTVGNQTWVWSTSIYDAQGSLTSQSGLNHDGTHWLTLDDVNNQYNWATATINYDANWNVTSVTGTNNGSHSVTMGDLAAAYDTATWYATPFDTIAAVATNGAIMTGSAGADTFVFNQPLLTPATITDFGAGADHLQISGSGFGHGLTAGGTAPLVTAADLASASHAGAGGYFIFDNAGANAGTLYWDATGSSGIDATALVHLNNVISLQSSDFHIV